MGLHKNFAMAAATAVMGMSIAATSAHAASIDLDSVVGKWTSTSPAGVTGLNTEEIRWGTPATTSGQSGYRFDGSAPPPIDGLAPDTPFVLGTFTHFNNPITGFSITSAELTVDVAIDVDGTPQTVTSVFDFGHLETPNAADPCADGGTVGVGVNVNGCADRVTALTNPASSTTFTVGTETFIFDILGFSTSPTGAPVFTEFWTVEQATNEAFLVARYTRKENLEPVPLPAAAWLLLAGLGSLGIAARRRKAG